MASSASSSPSPSPSPSPSRKRKYEVFLSFRGGDTRNTFVSHLHSALEHTGIISFLDEDHLKHGQSISSELVKAIEESKFAIIIFSKNYAASTWCLDELVKIMECRAQRGLTVVPIFYDADPSDLRNQKNSVAESFAKHELNFKDNMEKVQIWRNHLSEAANLAGVDVRGKNEASCVKKIAREILKKLPRKVFTKGLVGIESRLTQLRSLLFKKPNEVCFVGIWGMGGIGKTTIARAIFDEFIGEFEGSCFLQDVGKRDMVSLQEILLMKVLSTECVNIRDPYEGSWMIRERVNSRRVLLVLDNVDDVKQLKSLAGESEWFGAGSRIIITTRDKHLLNEVDETYEVDLLTDGEAMQLFRFHAFGNKSPSEEFVHLSHRVVSYARGLPLALEVLGCHLRGRGSAVWESALERLKDDPEDKIFGALKISFDGLNDSQRDTFLDIACFFRGRLLDDVKRKLHIFGFHPGEDIDVLIQKSLLLIQKADYYLPKGKIIEMHDLIQEMGCHIVRRKANKQLGRYSRLWLSDNVIDVLKDSAATSEIEAIVIEGYGRNSRDGLLGVHDNISIKLREGVFRNMKRLRLLEIRDCIFDGCPDHLPNSLRWLYWSHYPGISLPKNFEPWKLVVLELPSARIVHSPDFSAMPNLEVIELSGCEQLSELHPSIGNLNKLVRLHLRHCVELKMFPRIIQMENLRILDLGGCRELRSIPENINCCPRLQILHLWCCDKLEALPDLPPSIQELRLEDCEALTRIPNLVDLIAEFKDLYCLSLLGCWQLYGCLDKYDSTRISSLQQRVPEFLSAFWDWERVSKILCPRKEKLTVYLPEYKISDWFFPHTTEHSVIVSLSPSSYNDDKLRGFALCAIAEDRLEFSAFSGQSTRGRWPITPIEKNAHIGFSYIPIGKVTRGRVWEELKDCCLFKIITPSSQYAVTWGIRLVYEGQVGNDNINNNGFTVINREGPTTDYDPTLEFRVASQDY